jgi:4-amino-4-deoxy-L-arabinose transferase-like glycosyltransferase
MKLSTKNRAIVFGPPLICAVALAAAVAISHPVLEMATCDDWSYLWSARVLAETGHVVYNGWATAMLGWQLYLGAFFIKLFGFSFTSARLSILVVSMATVALVQRLFVRLGANQWNATIATLTLALSPLFLPMAYSFMSDVPGLFCIIVCFYGCVRAMQAESDKAAAGWIVFAALSNAFGGTVRQIAWLGALVVVPCTTWYLRRRTGVLLAGAVAWLVSVIAIVGCLYWFSLQPYSLTEKILLNSRNWIEFEMTVKKLVESCLAVCLFTLPVLIGFLWKLPLGSERVRKQSAIAGVFLMLIAVFLVVHNGATNWHYPFSGNIVTEKGMDEVSAIPGNPPDILPFSGRVILSVLTFAAAFSFLLVGWNTYSIENRASQSVSALPWKSLLTIFGPFTLASVFLLATRVDIYDRYLLPLIFVFLAILLRVYEEKVGDRLPKISVFMVFLFGAFAVAGMHDLFALGRARLTAINEMLAAGVVKTEIQAGFDYDGWTQLESTGYINDPRLRIPVGAFHPISRRTDIPGGCYYTFAKLSPSINRRYLLSFDQSSCFSPSQFAPVSYNAWLFPHTRFIYIQKVPLI